MTGPSRIAPGKPVPDGYRELKASEKHGQFIAGAKFRCRGDWDDVLCPREGRGSFAYKNTRIIVPVNPTVVIPPGFRLRTADDVNPWIDGGYYRSGNEWRQFIHPASGSNSPGCHAGPAGWEGIIVPINWLPAPDGYRFLTMDEKRLHYGELVGEMKWRYAMHSPSHVRGGLDWVHGGNIENVPHFYGCIPAGFEFEVERRNNVNATIQVTHITFDDYQNEPIYEPHAFDETSPTPWYAANGVMPCDGEAMVEIGLRDGCTDVGPANDWAWGRIAAEPEAEIIQWRLFPPEGDRWNNPDGVTWARLGAGFRFLTRREVNARAEALNTECDVPGPQRVGMWMVIGCYWRELAFGNDTYTYRVPINTPFFA